MTISIEVTEWVQDAGKCFVYTRRWTDRITGAIVRQDIHVQVKEGFDVFNEVN